MGKHLRVDRASSKVNPKDVSNTIFLGNLPEDVTEEELWALFKPIGGVTNVRVVRDKTGIGKGVAYVAFKVRFIEYSPHSN
jgi:RNA recognition motif-containing protein